MVQELRGEYTASTVSSAARSTSSNRVGKQVDQTATAASRSGSRPSSAGFKFLYIVNGTKCILFSF